MTLKFKGLKKRISFFKYIFVIFIFEKKNIKDNACIMTVGDKYVIKIFEPLKNIYSEVMKEDIK